MPEVCLAPAVDSCAFLFLEDIEELRASSRSLRVTVVEGIVGDEVYLLQVGNKSIDDVRSIQVTEQSRRFAIYWASYLAYSVRDESFMTETENEVLRSGKHARIYSKSNFLDYVARATWTMLPFSTSVNHVSIWCLTHIIDVAATELPDISLLARA